MNIKVSKLDLVETLVTNQLEHEEQYNIAIEKYREKALKHFNECIDLLKIKGQVEHYLRLPIPEQHLDDYQRALEMMKWHQGEYIELSDEQFECYVRNKWGWHKTFFANTGSYLES